MENERLKRLLTKTHAFARHNMRDGGRVIRWNVPILRGRAERRHHVLGFDLILDNDRYAVEWAPEFAGLGEFSIQFFGCFKSLRVDRNNRIDGRTRFVDFIDAVDIRCHQSFRRERMRLVGRVNIPDCCFLDLEIACHRSSPFSI